MARFGCTYLYIDVKTTSERCLGLHLYADWMQLVLQEVAGASVRRTAKIRQREQRSKKGPPCLKTYYIQGHTHY